MAIQMSTLQTAGYRKLTAHGTTGDECCICGRQTAGLDGALHVATDHCSSEFVTDDEAAERGEDRVSYFPVGPECVKKWRKATNGTSLRLLRADFRVPA